MKNSLFKRAFATVATVPVALAQCLTIANAVETNDNSAVVYTLTGENGLLTVDTKADYKLVDEKTYVAVSDWNEKLAAMMSQVGTGSVDVSDIVNEAVKKSGRYSELATAVADKLSAVKYTKDADGNLVLTAEIDNVAPAFETIAQKYVDEAIKGIEIEYDEQQEAIDKIKNTKFFDKVDISGTVKVVVNTSELANSTTVTAAVSFIYGDTEYHGTAIENFVQYKLAEVKAAAKDAIADIIEEYDLTADEIEQKVQESQEYKDLIQKLTDGYTPEPGEIESMVLESQEFQELVKKYMEDNGVNYEEAEAKMKESEKYQNLIDRFTNGINLSDDEIIAILEESDEYNKLVEEYMNENNVTADEAKTAVVDSDEYKALVEKFTEDYTYSAEEIEAMVKGSDEYKNKIEEIKDEYDEQFGMMKDKLANAESKIDKTVDSYASKINAGVNKLSQFENKSASGEYVNTAAAIAAAKARVAKSNVVPAKVKNYVSRMTTAEAAASTDIATKIFTKVINEINKTVAPSAVNVTASELGVYVDGFENINVNVENLNATVSATYADDADFADIQAYMLSEYNFEATESYMAVDVEANAADYKNGVVSVDFQLKRVVKGDKAVVTTTSTSTTTSTTTSPVTTVTDPTTTTVTDPTTTTVTDPATTTVTDPTTTTVTDPATTTVTDPTTTTVTDPTTTTVTDPTTTTVTDPATTTKPVTTTAPVTVTETVLNVNYDSQTKVGFYLNIDDEYNLDDQIESISATVKRTIKVTNEAGELVELLDDGEETIDLKGKVNYGTQKPSDKSKDEIFTGRDIVVYAAEDIKDSKGNLVVAAGEPLELEDGTVTVKCFVGIKGDIDFSGAADADDASAVLKLFALGQTGVDLSTIQFSPNTDVVTDPSSILDDFAAFLADVDADINSDNYCTLKTDKGRVLDADDASNILKMFAYTQSGYDESRATWDIVLGRTEEE